MKVDSAVKYRNKTYRFVSEDDKAGLFDRSGLVLALSVVSPPARGGRLPGVQSVDGEDVRITKISKPCSCMGGVWKMKLSELVSSL